MYIHQKNNTKAKSNDTGGGEGFRSSDYFPALIQTIFALSNLFNYICNVSFSYIGEVGDNLPNQVSFKFHKRNDIKNPSLWN